MGHRFLAAPLVLVLVAGCSSSDEDPAPVTSTDTGSTVVDATDDTATPQDSSTPNDTADEAPATPPATPTIVSVAKMAGNLHVTWKLNDTGLSNIELWRKKDGGEWTKTMTLPGKATSQHDTAAVAPGEYCYKVKTLRAGLESDFSGNKCGTP